MKTDDDSGEADEPPGEPPSSESIAETSEGEGNEELQWARRHVPGDWSGPRAVFRKTELHNRPPGPGGFRPATASTPERRDRIIEKMIARLDAIDDRLDEIEDRIDRATDRLDRRLLMLENKEVS